MFKICKKNQEPIRPSMEHLLKKDYLKEGDFFSGDCSLKVFSKVEVSGRGNYHTATGHPDGIVFHYTASQSKAKGKNLIELGARNGLKYDCIDLQGRYFQAGEKNQWGYHAGKSSMIYQGKKVNGVSRFLRGIEVVNEGKLFGCDRKTKKRIILNNEKSIKNYLKDKHCFYAWFDFDSKGFLKDHVNPIHTGDVNIFLKNSDNVFAGVYKMFSKEASCELLTQNINAKIEYIVSHDEVSKGKTDIGGCLGYSIQNFRELLTKKRKKKNEE